MRKVCSCSLGVVLLAVGFTSVWERPPAAPVPGTNIVEATGPAGPASAAAASLDPFARDLLTRLNSANAAEREAAQRQLSSIAGMMQSQEMLARLQESTTDQDLKDLFARRVSQIKAREEERRITNLPPVSLDISDANLNQLASALNDALGIPNEFQGQNGGSRGYTLTAKDKPFWELFVALSQQQPLTMQFARSPTGSTARLLPSGTAIRRYALNGPALAYVTNVTYQRSIRLQTPNAGDDSWGTPSADQGFLIITVTVLVDPRVRVLRFTYPVLISAVDDGGMDLPTPRSNASNWANASTNQFNHGFSVPAPDHLGKSLSFVCEMRISANASELTGAINDVENNLNKPVIVGSRTFRVLRFNPQGNPGNYSLQINVTDDSGGQGVPPGQPITSSNLIPYTLTDSTGRVVLNASAPGTGTFSLNVPAAGATGPFKLEFRVPGRTIEIPLRFEFKDVPLP